MENLVIYEQEQRINYLKETLIILFKHKVKVLTVFLVTALTVSAVTFFLVPVYEAKSTMLVKMGREYLNRPEVGDNKPVMSLNPDGIISSEIQIMTSRELIEKVINTIKIDTLYPDIPRDQSAKIRPLDIAALQFEKDLAVEGVKRSNVIQVSFRHKDPKIAAQAVNLLVEYFKEKHLQVFSEPQASYLEQQLEGYSLKLKESEKSLESYKQKNRVFSLDEQRSLLLKQRMELDTAMKNSTNGMSELQRKVATLRNQLKTISTSESNYASPESDRIIVDAKARLLALQLNEQELLKKYTDNNRMVINARKDIELVKNFLKEQQHDAGIKARTGSPLYNDINRELLRAETDLNSLTAKAASIRNQVQTADREIGSLNLTEQQLANLKREMIVNEKNYQSYQDRAEESRRLDEMNRLKLANISVIQSAAPPSKPVKPEKRKILQMGLLCAVGLGLASAFLCEYFSQTFSSPVKVEKLIGLPVLLSIPYSER